MSLKVLLIGALCLLATAESKAYSKSLKSAEPQVTTCSADCGDETINYPDEHVSDNPGPETEPTTEHKVEVSEPETTTKREETSEPDSSTKPGSDSTTDPEHEYEPSTEPTDPESTTKNKDVTGNESSPTDPESATEHDDSNSTTDPIYVSDTEPPTDPETTTEPESSTTDPEHHDPDSTTDPKYVSDTEPPTDPEPTTEPEPESTTKGPEEVSEPDPVTKAPELNKRVCQTECGISRTRKRADAILLKTINILKAEHKTKALSIFADLGLDNYSEEVRYIGILLGTYEGSFPGALENIDHLPKDNTHDSDILETGDAFDVIFGYKYHKTTINDSAAKVIFVAIYGAYRMENTKEELSDLGEFEGSFGAHVKVLIQLAFSVITETACDVSQEDRDSAFEALTSQSFSIKVEGEVITVEHIEISAGAHGEDEGSDKDWESEIIIDGEGEYNSESSTDSGGEGDSESQSSTDSSGEGNSESETGGDNESSGSGSITVGGSGSGFGIGGSFSHEHKGGISLGSSRARNTPLLKKSVKAHSLKSKSHSLKSKANSHAKTVKSHAKHAKAHAKHAKAHSKHAKAHQKSKSKSHHQKSKSHAKSSKAHQKSRNHQNKSKNHHSKSHASKSHASKSKGHAQKSKQQKNHQKSKSHQ